MFGKADRRLAFGGRRDFVMMILRSSGPSPFVRKVNIAARLLGLVEKIEIQPTDVNDPGDSVRRQNPLGKVPVLILDNGSVYYDSRVILEYFDHLAGGGRIVPKEPAARFAALTLQALCDGIMDASLLIVYEGRFRAADKRVESWVARQAEKVERGLAALEAAPPELTSPPDVGHIALACALGYRDLRFDGRWRKDHPRLVAWHDSFAAQVPAFAATNVTA
jgi:glutathione S-transferase